MAIVVEHDKRKHEILQKSLDVFIDEGYEDATFQKIAGQNIRSILTKFTNTRTKGFFNSL